MAGPIFRYPKSKRRKLVRRAWVRAFSEGIDPYLIRCPYRDEVRASGWRAGRRTARTAR